MVIFILFKVHNDSTDTLQVYQICSHPEYEYEYEYIFPFKLCTV